jgi:ABC-type sulfate transport system substrate-binding protein
VADRRGSRKLADAYLQFLYTEAGQEVIAKHHLRPRNEKVLARYAKDFPKVQTFTIDEVFGGWKAAQKAHFADGGLYDQIVSSNKR